MWETDVKRFVFITINGHFTNEWTSWLVNDKKTYPLKEKLDISGVIGSVGL